MLDFDLEQEESDDTKMQGKWDVKKIDEPDIKGYIIKGQFFSGSPLNDSEPYEPFNPNPIRRPLPQRPERIEEIEEIKSEPRDPLTDVFEENNAIKIYIEMPGQEKDDIQLNIIEGKIEVRTKDFIKVVDIPGNVEKEKASAQYKNGVLTLTIPKREQTSEATKQKIRIE